MPITVVVADDSPDYRAAVRLVLQPVADMVSVVGEAGDGREALEVIRRERPDIVVADFVMPGLDGFELATQVKRVRPATKVIIMASYIGGTFQPLASRSGADGYVNKLEIGGSLRQAILDIVSRRLSDRSGPFFARPGLA
jgi:two-component system, NarL family, nitrate/nitrite response regulator NarL